jgi:hypothetical protein
LEYHQKLDIISRVMEMHIRPSYSQSQPGMPQGPANPANPKFLGNMNMVVPSNATQFKIAPHFMGGAADDALFLLASGKRPKNMDVFVDSNPGGSNRYALQTYAADQDGVLHPSSPKPIDWERVTMEHSQAPVNTHG